MLAAGPGGPEPEPAEVVASLVHLGLVARLVSPLLGAALLVGVLPVAPIELVHVRLAGVNPLPLAVVAASPTEIGSAADLAAAFNGSWLVPGVEPLTGACAARGRSPSRCSMATWRPPWPALSGWLRMPGPT